MSQTLGFHGLRMHTRKHDSVIGSCHDAARDMTLRVVCMAASRDGKWSLWLLAIFRLTYLWPVDSSPSYLLLAEVSWAGHFNILRVARLLGLQSDHENYNVQPRSGPSCSHFLLTSLP